VDSSTRERRSESLKIGDWRVDIQARIARCGERYTRLEPRPMAVLLCLAKANGELLSVQELKSAVWGETHVVDDVVKRCISQIRMAFGDDAKTQAIIATTPKQGYCIACEVNWTSEVEEQQSVSLRDFFRWIPPIQVRTQPIIGVCFTLVLVFCAIYFLAINQSVQGTTDKPKVFLDTKYAQAEEYYARYEFKDNESAIAIYRGIVLAHPKEARAYAGLANGLLQRFTRWDGSDAALDEARQAATTALQMDAMLADGHKALGLYYQINAQYAKAIASYKSAIERDRTAWAPVNNIAEVYRAMDDLQSAINWFECALQITENRESSLTALGELHFRLGSYDTAHSYFNDALTLAPYSEDAHIGLSFVSLYQRQPLMSEGYCEHLLSVNPVAHDCRANIGVAALLASDFERAADTFDTLANNGSPYWAVVGKVRRFQALAGVSRTISRTDEAAELTKSIELAVVEKVIASAQAEWLKALVSASVGKLHEATEQYEIALAQGHRAITWDFIEPGFVTLRKEEPFNRLLNEARKKNQSKASKILSDNKRSLQKQCFI